MSGDGKITYWLGTDGQARDMMSAIFYGMRISLFVGFVSVLAALAIGVVVGLVAAYAGGRIDALLMRIVDILLSFPAILVALILLSVLGKGIDKVLIALILVQWAYFARAVARRRAGRAQQGICRGRDLPRAAAVAHRVPPHAAQLHAVADRDRHHHARPRHRARGDALLPRRRRAGHPASLGMLISNGFEFLLSGSYWISFFPGVALAIAIVGINLAGDHLRDVLNPRNLSDERRRTRSVRNLRTHFFTREGVARAVDGVDFDVAPGEILGLVGESGSGKTVTGFSILGLIDPPGRIVEGSSIHFNGEELTTATPERLRAIRGAAIAMIFQDPMMTLNPVLRVDTQMIETVQAHVKVSARRGARPRPRRAGAGRHPLARRAAARLSAPVLRRHAPARGDRHRASAQAQADRRRRADHRARRHHPGPDPVRGAAALPRVRHGDDLGHPRSRRGGRASPTASP